MPLTMATAIFDVKGGGAHLDSTTKLGACAGRARTPLRAMKRQTVRFYRTAARSGVRALPLKVNDWGRWLSWGLAALVLICGAMPARLGAESESPASRLERIYRETSAGLKESPANIEAAWKFARACFDLAELAKNDSDRAALA